MKFSIKTIYLLFSFSICCFFLNCSDNNPIHSPILNNTPIITSYSYSRLNGITGIDEQNIFVSSENFILKYNGYKWDTVQSIDKYTNLGLYNLGKGYLGTFGYLDKFGEKEYLIQLYNSGNWNNIELPDSMNANLYSYWANSPENIFCNFYTSIWLGISLHLYHFNGSKWENLTPKLESIGLTAVQNVHGVSSNSVYFTSNDGIVHYDGQNFTIVNDSLKSGRIYGTSDNNLYYFTSNYNASIYHFDGVNWTKLDAPLARSLSTISINDDVYYQSMEYQIIQLSGTNYDYKDFQIDKSLPYFWMNSEDKLYGISRKDDIDCVYSYTVRDSVMLYSSIKNSDFKTIFGLSSYEVYAVSDNLYHTNGNIWETITIDNGSFIPHDIWGASKTNLYVIGGSNNNGSPNKNIIMHFDGYSWYSVYESDRGLNDIWGLDKNTIYAVGDRTGIICSYDGNSWREINIDPEYTLLKVFGSSEDNIYMVGYCNPLNGGTYNIVLKYDGTELKLLDTLHYRWSDIGRLDGIWAASDHNIYIAGDNGIVEFDGDSTFSKLDLQDTYSYSSAKTLYGSNDSSLLYFTYPYLYKYQNGSVSVIDDLYSSSGIISMWGDPFNYLYMAGYNSTIIKIDWLK